MTMPDGHAPTPPPLTDAALRRAILELWPLADVDSVAGLKARYRDPREMPGTGGEQRDAAAALDAASECGRLDAHRVAHRRFGCLPPAHRATALWLAAWGGAVRKGALVTVAAVVAHFGETSGPLALREEARIARDAYRLASLRHAAAKRKTRGPMKREDALAIDKARDAEASAAARHHRAAAALDAWARAVLSEFLPAWEATNNDCNDEEA